MQAQRKCAEALLPAHVPVYEVSSGGGGRGEINGEKKPSIWINPEGQVGPQQQIHHHPKFAKQIRTATYHMK